MRRELAAPGSVTFTEILYHSPAAEGLEWVELHNPMVLDMDVSGWAIEGGVRYAFAEGTLIPPGGYLVVAADPALLARETGFATALGPYKGSLSNRGERLDLFNNVGRRIDTVAYADDEPWPVQADGSGLSLAKMDPVSASDHAENWTLSAGLGGTPGQANDLDPLEPPTTLSLVSSDATWAYDLSGDYPVDHWSEPTCDDRAWEHGEATFYAGELSPGGEPSLATARITADNYFAIYLGGEEGGDLHLVGQDSDGDWTSVEGFDLEVGPEDHVYLAAWEAPGSSGGPQMIIAEFEMPDDLVGTDAASFEWVLGPLDGCPGTTPSDPPPLEERIRLLIEEADVSGTWALPEVQAVRTSDPWGWAVSGSFDDATRYIWADTFSSDSVTNAANTYALFRSREPLLARRGTTELPVIPITTTFRTTFAFDADPAATTLSLDCVIDDGAIFYLDGIEVLRWNMPPGPVDATTLAAVPVDAPVSFHAEIPAGTLTPGPGVLAVELHQAEPDDPDLTFGCTLTARVSHEMGVSSLLLNEVAPAAASPFWVELFNASPSPQETGGLLLASSAGGEFVLPPGELKPDGLLALNVRGLSLAPDDVLFLYSADRSVLHDAVRVRSELRGRADDGGPWRFPSLATPGDANLVEANEDVVLHEIQYHPSSATEGTGEWIELYNRGARSVDLSGWQLVDAVAFTFPAGTVLAPDAYLVVAGDAGAMRAAHPDIAVVGDFEGRLGNESDRILLLDARRNPADEVRYFDGGRWPAAADGGGSTLELRDARADNGAAEAWAASDEGSRTAWVTYSYRGTANPSAVGPDGAWDELVLGLLDAGEILVDDLSVVLDPDTRPVEMLRNGSFEAGSEHWRPLGTHRHAEIVSDPDDPANRVLRLVATGPTGHMHNHVETTLLQPIRTRDYEISFRARWVSGSHQLNTRLYFNRLARTTLLERPALSGTPGAPNLARVDNLGPTFSDLGQDPALPAAWEPVRISVQVEDPDAVAGVTLWSSVAGAAFGSQPMTEVEPSRWEALIEGEASGTIVQFYVEAEDGLGVRAFFPAAGPDSRALLQFDDGAAATNGLHNLRLLMTPSDVDWLHDEVNLMSDDLVGATVIYDEAKVFYDVGLRTKGSERGRPMAARLGYAVRFQREQPFRGSHTSVLIDRSEGVNYGQREVLLNLVMTHAGSVSGEYNDLIQALTPLSEHRGPAELQLDRFSDLVLASQFEDGERGGLFEYELIYYPLTTDDGTAEGQKLPQPDAVVGTTLTDLGDDKEAYRWTFLVQNNEREDDYDRIIDLCQTFGLSGTDFLEESGDVIDVDQWLRAFAFATLAGAVDQYGGDGSQHNAQFYVRPEDQRVLYFPHDLDFFGSSRMAVVGNGDLARLLEDPVNRRSYYGHLRDIIERAYNGDYLAPWCARLGALLPAQDFVTSCQFIVDRADWVLRSSPEGVMALHPPVDFRVTTRGGEAFSVASREVQLEGEAWIDTRHIGLMGASRPLKTTWLDARTWRVTVPLRKGRNHLTLVAYDVAGEMVGSDSLVVTSTGAP